MIFLGTIVNSVGIVVGSVLGALLTNLLARSKKLSALPDKLMKAVGLCVIYIGIEGTFENQNTLVLIVSMVIGTLIGELIDIDKHLNTLGAFVERKLTKKVYDAEGNEVTEDKGLAKAFVSATLLFCVGAMAITGAIEDLLMGDTITGLLRLCESVIAACAIAAGFAVATYACGATELITLD